MSNIILCGYPEDSETKSLIAFLANRGVNTSIVISSDQFSFKDKNDTEFISHTTLVDIILQKRECSNLNSDGLKFISGYHAMILRAMSRWDESVSNIDDKLFIIDNMFLYFVGKLEQRKVDLILYGTGSPHHFYNLILFFAAKYLSVVNLFPIANWVTNRVRFVREDFNQTVPVNGFGDDSGKMLKYLLEIKNHKEILTFHAARVYRDKSTFSFPLFFVKVLFPQFLGRIKHIWKRQKDLNISGRYSRLTKIYLLLTETIRSQLSKRSFKIYYRKNTVNEIPNNSVIFYAQNQPEATSHPDGGMYPDLRYWVHMFESLGEKVFYKEHRANFVHHTDKSIVDTSKHRSSYYLDFFIENGVKLLPETLSTASLIERNNKIFTFAGSIILECMVKGAPVMYCGLPFHGDLPGVSVVFESENIILKSAGNIDFDTIVSFFEEQDKYSIPNYSGFATAVREDVPFEKSAQFIYDVIQWNLSN